MEPLVYLAAVGLLVGFDWFDRRRLRIQFRQLEGRVMATKAEFDATISDIRAAIAGITGDVDAQAGEIATLQQRVTDLEAELAQGGMTAEEEAAHKADLEVVKAELQALDAKRSPAPEPEPEPEPQP